MHENRFFTVGRIESIKRVEQGLRLVLGGGGAVKCLAAVEIRNAQIIEIISQPAAGFAVGDIVSVSGRLELDPATGILTAVAGDKESVSRIQRAAPPAKAPAPARAAPPQNHPAPVAASAPAEANGMFGSSRPTPPTDHDPGVPDLGPEPPPLPSGFPQIAAGDQGDDIPFAPHAARGRWASV